MKILKLAILLVCYSAVFGQNPRLIDSLIRILEQNQLENDSLRVALYSGLTANYYPVNKDSAEYYNRMGYELAREAGLKKQEVLALINIGAFHYEKGEYDQAEVIYNEVLALSETLDFERSKLFANWNLANLNAARGDYTLAMERYIKASEIAEKSADSQSLAQLFINISNAANELKLREERKTYAKKALEIAGELNNSYVVGHAYTAIANSFFEVDLDSAAYYFEKADSIESVVGIPNLSWEIHTGLGHVSMQRSLFRNSLNHFRLSKQMSAKTGHHVQKFRSACDLARAFLKLNIMDSAAHYFEEFEEIIKKEGQVYFKGGCYEAIIEFYEKKGEYERANRYYKLLNEISDSIFNKEIKVSVLDLERKYNISQKENQILDQELNLQQRTKQRNNYIFLLILISFIGIATFFIFRQRYLRRIELNKKEKQLQDQRIEALEQEKRILAMSSMIEGQESERARIAKDLHDGLGVLLSSVRRQVQNVQIELRKLTEIDVIGDTEKLVATACEEVRRISHDMMPDALINFGIKEAIVDLGDQIASDHQLEVDIDIPDDLHLDEIQAINLYRIVQEITNNTIKHANASNVNIWLHRDTQKLILKISDDGKGIDLSSLRDKSGIGLSNIRSRVNFLNGSIEILSENGTAFIIEIPLE